MGKYKFVQWILVFVLTCNINKMNAQENKLNESRLTDQQQSIITISSLTASGDSKNLKTALTKGLEAGLTVNEIKEILVHTYAYCGFPRSLNAINTFKGVLEDRKTKGITDKIGKEIIVENDNPNKYEQGRKVLEELTNTLQPKPAKGYGEFAPRVDAFLKEHLFADVFASDVLSYQQRELVTISVLAAMPGVEPQLQSHIGLGRNTGITENQLQQLASLIEQNINKTQANTVRKIIGTPLSPIVEPEMMVRISEIEILPKFLEEYKSILKEEAATSLKVEPGVIAIFPMYQQEDPTQIRIIEIYANKAAYQSHLQTPHFQYYKTSTLKMVKSLKLIEMNSIDKEAMTEIYKKLK